MTYEIIWQPNAIERLDEIVEYLRKEWSEKSAEKFISRLNSVLTNIEMEPNIYRHSNGSGIYEAIITKHNILLYQVTRHYVEYLPFLTPDKIRQKNMNSVLFSVFHKSVYA